MSDPHDTPAEQPDDAAADPVSPQPEPAHQAEAEVPEVERTAERPAVRDDAPAEEPADAPADEPLIATHEDDRTPPKGGKVAVVTVLALALLAGGGYVAAYAGAGDRLPNGTTIAGVPVGGKDRDAAIAALRTGLADRTDRPVTVQVGDVERTVEPEAVGLAVDLEASVDAAGGRGGWSPQRLWDHYTGGDDLDAVVDVDQTRLDRVLQAISDEAGTAPVEGSIGFDGGEVAVTEPRDGRALNLGTAATAVREAYVSQDGTADLDLETVAPTTDADDVAEARSSFADNAVAASVRLRFDGTTIGLRPSQFGEALRMVPDDDGALRPEVDSEVLQRLVDARTSGTDAPVDATVRLVDGEPTVIPGKPGVGYDPDELDRVFLAAVEGTGGRRTGTVEAETTQPDFTTQDAERLGIKEEVSSFTTYFPYAEYRNVNIGRAGELIDGTVLKPGETFSLNDTVGERTVENGFTTGTIISNGIFREDLGGGVSQMATTTFNAAFFAGLEDVEHKPHSVYIDRYPVGREATVAWGSVDLRFKNDTKYGVLIDVNVVPSTPGSRGSATVTMYSTKVWDITSTTGNRYNLTSPSTRRISGPGCLPNAGYGGFDIDVTRYFRRPGSSALVRSEKFTTTYIPSDTVICTGDGDDTGD